jgi:hypothetical protein
VGLFLKAKSMRHICSGMPVKSEANWGGLAESKLKSPWWAALASMSYDKSLGILGNLSANIWGNP